MPDTYGLLLLRFAGLLRAHDLLDEALELLALDAHAAHPGPFTVDDLLLYRTAREPPCQSEARNRRTIMRKARSKKQRPLLLAELERRYRESPNF